MPRVLSLVWYKILPPRFGGQKGIALFSKYLAGKLELICLCSSNNQPAGNEPYRVLTRLPVSKLQFFSLLNYRNIKHISRDLSPTHLLIEHCYYGWIAKRLARKQCLKLIVHSHNIEYLRFRQMGKWWWPLLYQLEKAAHQAADLSLFKTEEDLRHALSQFRLDVKKTMVVPFGIEREAVPDKEVMQRSRAELTRRFDLDPAKRIILFNGTLDYAPNALALEHIVNILIPELEKISPDFNVIVTGRIEFPEFRHLLELKHPRYIYAGNVDNVETFFSGADAFINPVTEGGGVKVKLMEALSFGLPVVSYESGARGIDLQRTGSGLHVVPNNNAREMARQIMACWQVKPIIPTEFFVTYHWEQITARTAEMINKL